ncbi:hypothetical protein SAMN04487866_12221 [Thermoactinomyces sp. DSM 45891]|uniref:hypothetical protein n=1 Tax=Thermoactinomyces sp. DSM 45891 TaxID=1761907 RepID=UPI0009162777|nr:hypothetical protein [Thermoactinomyces sp. DSM 45891]SFX74871.1 hypothetical protein SAMN04487866_12221 [Thermoactinomyces sp. DSM 45891]
MIDVSRFVQIELFLLDGSRFYINPDCLPDQLEENPMTTKFGTTWIAVTCGDCQHLNQSTCRMSSQKHCTDWQACGLFSLKI